jgi:hypothetical protein
MRPSILNPLFADAIPEIGIAPPSKRRRLFLRETDGLEKADGYCRSWRAWRGVCARSVGVDNKSMHEINA